MATTNIPTISSFACCQSNYNSLGWFSQCTETIVRMILLFTLYIYNVTYYNLVCWCWYIPASLNSLVSSELSMLSDCCNSFNLSLGTIGSDESDWWRGRPRSFIHVSNKSGSRHNTLPKRNYWKIKHCYWLLTQSATHYIYNWSVVSTISPI